jgi:hypothetical protein
VDSKLKIFGIVLAVLLLASIPIYVIAQDATEKEQTKEAVKIDETDQGGGQEVEQVEVEQAPVDQAVHEEIHSSDQQIESGLHRSAMASDVVGPRPDPEGVPTDVKVGIFIFDIPKISDADQTFDTEFRIITRWFDPRLAHHEKGIRQMNLEEIWNPLISVMNVRDFKRMNDDDEVYVDHEGHCINVSRYIAKLTVPLNLRNFPNDKHGLYIKARSYYGPEEVKLTIDKDLTGWSKVLSIPDWDISNGQAKINTHESETQDRELAQMEFSFKIKRFFGFYFWRIIIPLTLIVLMSWGVFWIDPRRLEAMVGLSATSILTLFAFQFAIGALLPRISYLTRIDKFTMLSSLLIFLALIEALVTAYLGRKDRIGQALVLDRISRVMFPLTFGAIVYYAFFY